MNNNITDFENETFDISEFGESDIKINPDLYIHRALLNAQACLMKEDVNLGFLQFRVVVEHLEILCKAANRVPTDYEEKLKKAREELKETDKDTFRVQLANKKLGLLVEDVFNSKTITTPLKLNVKKN
jgi:hypothetical protein